MAAVPEYYDRNERWPKPSLERRAALLASLPPRKGWPLD
jgi:hypothetical protein